MDAGYIYVRSNEYWDLYNAYKLGKTSNIPDRENTYITSEIKRGYYVMIIEFNLKILDKIEKKLQIYFNKLNLHIKYNAGVEFYKKEIIDFIIPYLNQNRIEYKILSTDEIDNLVKKTRVYNKDTSDSSDSSDNESIGDINNEVENKNLNKRYTPRADQIIIIEKAVIHFKQYDKGVLVLMCGVGKTLISLWVTQELNSNTILIGVPNKLLLKQWEDVICNLFQNVPYLIVSGGITIDNIIQFLEKNQTKCIIITTYASAHKVLAASKYTNFVFSIKINDECHHLTSTNMRIEGNTKKFIEMLNIQSVKQLSLTATLKQLECDYNDNIIISNDNLEYFGEIIDRKCLLWAINENIVCDYIIQTIITNEERLEEQFTKFNINEENDKRLFLSVFASLKSIFDGHTHHLLIYSNNKDNSFKLIEYIKLLLYDKYFDIHDLYYSNYHSEMKSKDQKEIIKNFEKAQFGIIACVYCLGEGWDFPLLDAVVFSENMSSNIRIVQSALRASRKNKLYPNKITKIILPVLNKDDWLENNNNSDLKKVREVIYQMGLEDETITQKIVVLKISIEKPKPINPKPLKELPFINDFGEYDDELTQKLRLKTIKRTTLGTSYEKAIKIIADKNIKSKEGYYELCEKDNRLSRDPEIDFNGKFTNWIEYLSIERIYYDLEACKNKVCEHLELYPNIKKNYLDLSLLCKELCKLDSCYPPYGLWIEYYNVKTLQDIITIINKKKKMDVVL